jgi:hypothetical protein
MARPVGSQSIKGWQEHELLRDLALGEESPDELAAKYDRPVQTIYDFRWRNKHRINVVLAEWSDQFSDLWSVKKHARMADLQYQADTLQELMNELKEDAAAATETMRRVDPDASPVRVPTREYRGLVRDKAKLLDQIEDSMGQRVRDAAVIAGDYGGPKTRMQLAGLKPDARTPAPAIEGPRLPEQSDENPTMGGGRQVSELQQELAFSNSYIEKVDADLARIMDRFAERLANDAQLRDMLAVEMGPSWYSGDDPGRPADPVAAFRQQLIDDERHRYEVAELAAVKFYSSEAATVAPAVADDGQSVEEETEPVDRLVRMPALPAKDGPEPAVDEPAPVEVVEDVPVETVVDEAVEPEIPAVAPGVEQAARDLASQIWFSGPVPRATLGPANDQALTCAIEMGWVEVRETLVVRGLVAPHPVVTTKIPNW